MPRLDVIIPVRNDEKGLARCLKSIRAARAVDWLEVQVIVADNGSRDGSAKVAEEWGAVVLSVPGLRVSAVRNRAVAAGAGEWIGFVDADHEIDAGWFDSVAGVMGDLTVAGAGAPYHPPSSPTWVQRIYDGLRRHTDRIEETRWLASGNLVVRRSVFEAMGGFDESLDTCEDVDLCYRLGSGGQRLLQVPGMHSVHHGDPATLRALFKSELWRGRDNIRVTFRHGIGWRDVPSVGFPLAGIAGTLAIVVLGAASPWIGPCWWLIPLAGMLLVVCARAALLLLRTAPNSPLEIPRYFAFAGTYEAARAGSLIARAGHRRA